MSIDLPSSDGQIRLGNNRLWIIWTILLTAK